MFETYYEPGYPQNSLLRLGYDEDDDRFAQFLVGQEHVVVAARKHWLLLVRPVCGLIAAIFGVLFIAIGFPATLSALKIAALLWFLVLIGFAAWKFKQWQNEWFVATNRRVFVIHGVFSSNLSTMGLAKVTDFQHKRSWLGKKIGYGTLVLENAGQDQGMHEVTNLPYPMLIYKALGAELFKEKHIIAFDPRGHQLRNVKNLMRRVQAVLLRRDRVAQTAHPVMAEGRVIHYGDPDYDLACASIGEAEIQRPDPDTMPMPTVAPENKPQTVDVTETRKESELAAAGASGQRNSSESSAQSSQQYLKPGEYISQSEEKGNLEQVIYYKTPDARSKSSKSSQANKARGTSPSKSGGTPRGGGNRSSGGGSRGGGGGARGR